MLSVCCFLFSRYCISNFLGVGLSCQHFNAFKCGLCPLGGGGRGTAVVKGMVSKQTVYV